MAIVQISRIQHRRGVADNLPQLAVGELGLAVDTRRIYIGNGGTDAPQIENIELLTANSDLLDSADTYTYKGAAAGYNATTGTTANDPITRTMQQKYDDFASVKDFSATGDGVTDDTAAINRALFQLFSRATNTEIRRALFFPAGTYIVTDVLKIPPYAKLWGDGHNSSIIKGTNASVDAVAMTSDALQQIDGSVGASGAALPGNVNIDGLTFWASVDTVDAFVVNQAKTVTFSNCRFQGFQTSVPSAIGNSQAALKLESSTTRQTEHVQLVGCKFTSSNLLVLADHDMSSVTFSGCEFDTAFKAVKIGEGRTGVAPAVDGPRGVKVTNSLFDDIYNRAIHVYFGPGFTSANNTFKDCANNNLGSGNASTHVIEYAGTGMHSIGDDFERPDADQTTSTLRVKHFGVSVQDSATEFGTYIRKYGQTATLTDNVSNQSTGITFSDNSGLESSIEIDFNITRGATIRQGTLRITQDATAQLLDEDFSEHNGSVGVTFNLTNSSNITTLQYTTTSTGSAATFNYSIRLIQ
jgi:hypothetical protein